MTTLSADIPVVFDLRENSNTQYNFLGFLTYLIDEGHLVEGDYLVCDNAAVHVGSATIDATFDLLDAAGVKLIFLPTYSPELNPCELVFGEIKRRVRNSRDFRSSLWLVVVVSICDVSLENVISYYRHCILH